MKNLDRDTDSEQPESSSARVLLVDDDPSFGKIMSRISEQSNVQMTVCRSWSEVEKVLSWKFDVAIVDYDLGDVTGIEITRHLESNSNKVPVILVSQSQMVDMPISAWPASIKGFFQKSVGHFAILEAALAAHDSAIGHPHAG